MMTDAADVTGEPATRAQIGGVAVERFAHRAGAAAGRGAACRLAGLVLRLPEGQDMLAVGFLVVVADGKCLLPAAAVAIGDAHDPSTSADAAAIAERNSRRDGGEVMRLPAHRQLEPVGAVFEMRGARAAGHWRSVLSVCVHGSAPAMGVEAGGTSCKNIETISARSSA